MNLTSSQVELHISSLFTSVVFGRKGLQAVWLHCLRWQDE